MCLVGLFVINGQKCSYFRGHAGIYVLEESKECSGGVAEGCLLTCYIHEPNVSPGFLNINVTATCISIKIRELFFWFSTILVSDQVKPNYLLVTT